MDAQYQSLLSGDAAAFEALVQQLMSADNDKRQPAEALLEQLKQHSADLVLTNLTLLLRRSQDAGSRDMSAVLLRKACQSEADLSNAYKQPLKHLHWVAGSD